MTSWTPALASRSGPIYLAIADALGDDVSRGRLASGARLPTHRELAETLGVTVGTVSRGYAEAARRGLLSGEVGRGSFVRPVSSELPALSPSAAEAGLVDLSFNHPPPLAGDRQEALQKTLAGLGRRADLASLLDYAPDGGAAEHRAAGAAWLAMAGVKADPAEVVVTNGSQHGLTAVFGALTRPGDLVVTESLTYPGVKALASLLHLRLQGLPLDRHGLDPGAFEAACKSGGVRALYTIPTLQNPTASVMPESRRREILRIARGHGVLVIEDDVHGLLPDDAPPPLAALAPDIVAYVAGTAKSLAPGLRVGFVKAPAPLLPRLKAGVRATTWMATPLMAEIATLWIRDGTAQRILKRRREEMRARQKLAAEALRALSFDTHPAANHLWLHLPEPWRSESFAESARRRGVAVTAAQAFMVGRAAAPHAVRVCPGAASSREELSRGLALLRETLEGPAEAGLMVV